MSDIQRSESLAKPRVGDLVKFRGNSMRFQGIVLSLETLPEGPHPSQPEREVAFIEWANAHTPRGMYQIHLLEVVNEVS